jgi:hypothetical protein
MNMRRRVVVSASAVSLLMVAAGQVAASANMVWCVSDPPIQVVTPGGHNLTVNNTVYLPPSSQHLKGLISEDASAIPDGHGGSLVVVHVFIPGGVSNGHVVSAENRFQISSEGSGSGGTLVTLYLDVPTS